MIEFVALVDRLYKTGHDDMTLVFGYSISSAVEHFNKQELLLVTGSVSEGILQYHRESETAPPE